MSKPTGTRACRLQKHRGRAGSKGRGPAGSKARSQTLLRRSGIGVRFYFAALFLDNAAQLALHGFERVVDHFGKWGVGAVVHPFFIRDQFMTGRDGDIDPDPKRISFLMGVVWLLDGDVAAVDVIAEFFQARRFLHDELVDVIGFRDAAVGDIDG